MSEDLILIKEYIDGLGLKVREMKEEEFLTLSEAIKDDGDSGLAALVLRLKDSGDIQEYLEEEEV